MGTAWRSLCPESPRTEGLFGSFSGLPARLAVGPSGFWKLLGDSSLNTGPNTRVPGCRQWIGPRDTPSCLRFPDLSCRHSPAHMTSGCPLPEDMCPWSPHRAGGCRAGPDLWGSSLGSHQGLMLSCPSNLLEFSRLRPPTSVQMVLLQGTHQQVALWLSTEAGHCKLIPWTSEL